jgi:2-polyprenyl-3-methyl-5-hydroxy-6-metoxy-1,4-benzoquinol methylase
MFRIDTSRRSTKAEIMDDFELQGTELYKTLKDLDKINAWLGGNQITLNGIQELLMEIPKGQRIKIADIGCGSGAMLRKIADWGTNTGRHLELVGIDANLHAIEIAKELSMEYPHIDYHNVNIFSEDFKKLKFDIILCTLTLHHFVDAQILEILKQFKTQSKIGIVINDLHRTSVAYNLFKAFCSVFVNNEIARKDGLTSILRGFKRSDLEEYSKHIEAKTQCIKWKWAFRYQWIIVN